MTKLPESIVRGLVVSVIIPQTDIAATDRGKREMFVEIARAESEFNTDAVGAAGEIGIWQIHPVHFPALENLGVVSDPATNLKNPVANAQAAAYVYGAQGFEAWTTATAASREAERRGNIDLALDDDKAMTELQGFDWSFITGGTADLFPDWISGGAVDLLPDIPNPLEWTDALGNVLGIITDPEFWKRVGIGLLGATVIIAAVIFWNKDSIVQTAGAIK